jgi:hypothetical protein
MARKKVSRTLAELPPASAIRKRDHRTDRLLEILRGVAITNQKEQPQPFYSIREVASRFRMPLSSVSGIYRNLEQEGLLSRVRSSKTMLQGSTYDRRLSVRAFVGLPALFSAFMTIQDYRMFFIRIRRELRLRSFATAMLFFQPEAAEIGALSERLKAYEVDTVLWFQPPAGAKDTLLRLADRGICVLAVTAEPVSFISSRYEVRRDVAVRQLLGQWKSLHGVNKVTLVRSDEHPAPANEAALLTALKELQIRREVVAFKDQRSEQFIRKLKTIKSDGILFASSAPVSMLCFRRPGAVTELLRIQRVALVGGPINMPFVRVPDVQVDLVTIDWQQAAKAIVNDLITQEAFQKHRTTVFEAQAHLRVPLNQFAQQI